MKRILLMMLISLSFTGKAQVDEVSVIIAPTVSYQINDKNSTIGNGFMVGAQTGFSFGKVLELKALYQRSIGIKQNFKEYENDIKTYYPLFDFNNRDLTVTHIGGEFKGNIPIGKLNPYLLLGTGVQTIKRESYFSSGNDINTNLSKSEYEVQTLYGTGGLGIKINLGNRATLNFEGKGFIYNLAPSSLLYDEGGSIGFTNWVRQQDKQRMINWSVGAGLQLYLGGTNYDKLSDMDRAYLKRFGSGLKGFKLTLAPGIAFLNFNKGTAYKNTYALGGTLGFEISDYVGFRGFYYQAMDNGSSFKFDKLSLYGGDFVGKLNGARGIVPFITVGGGYIRVADEYKGRDAETTPGVDSALARRAQSGYFAKGGIGVNIPLSKHVELFGAANVLYTVNDKNTAVEDLRSVSELNGHTMFNFGVRLKLGKKVKTDRYTSTGKKDNGNERMKRRIEELEEKLASAESKQATAEETEATEKAGDIHITNETAHEGKETRRDAAAVENSKVFLTPAELESMIDKVVKGVESDNASDLQKRMNRLEYLLLQMNRGTLYPPNYQAPAANNETADRLLLEIKLLNEKIEMQNKKINEINRRD